MTDTISIRPAEEADLPAISEVQVQSWHEIYTKILPQSCIESRTVERRLAMWTSVLGKPGQHLWVGLHEGVVKAFVSAGPGRAEVDVSAGEIYAIYALRSCHGLGIGSALFRQATDCLRRDGYETAVLTVLTENPTVEFYRRMGGEVARKIQADFGGRQIDELVMRFELL
jgi:ribosomal protein S18 acetylase RimI-like enzyme